ncbi:MAG: arsenate reductase ArsC [archaeon]|nr:arsenate reductase ArsC [archaeon]MCP8321477.1 arsenate reductase ArsC [archaeon]
MKKILFVCVENSARSQMAEGFAKYYGKGKVKAYSAGTKIAREINPTVVKVMAEKGIDISKQKPKLLDLKMVEKADIIIAMGCNLEEFCPVPLLKKAINWGIEGPKGKPIEKVREIRDKIEIKVKELLENL